MNNLNEKKDLEYNLWKWNRYKSVGGSPDNPHKRKPSKCTNFGFALGERINHYKNFFYYK